jgi:hypothetical protein
MPVRFNLQLPEWYDRRLRLWAKYKGTAKATLAANILQSRIESNWVEVEKGIEEVARSKGMTREQLEAEWLNGSSEEDEAL